MHKHHQLVTRRPCGNGYSVEPILSEQEFTHWLTLGEREIPESEKSTLGPRVSAYDGALLEEFFATLPERITFWTRTRDGQLAKNRASSEDDGERVGTSEIAAYKTTRSSFPSMVISASTSLRSRCATASTLRDGTGTLHTKHRATPRCRRFTRQSRSSSF